MPRPRSSLTGVGPAANVRAEADDSMSAIGGTAIGRDELLERASALVPVLAERALQTEQQRRIPDETIKDLVGAGLLRVATIFGRC